MYIIMEGLIGRLDERSLLLDVARVTNSMALEMVEMSEEHRTATGNTRNSLLHITRHRFLVISNK